MPPSLTNDGLDPTGETSSNWWVGGPEDQGMEPNWDTYGDEWWYDENGYPTSGDNGDDFSQFF